MSMFVQVVAYCADGFQAIQTCKKNQEVPSKRAGAGDV